MYALEAQLSITTSWTPEDAEYRETLGYLQTRKFRQGLDRLQHLVLQRLQELSKAHMSKTGIFCLASYIPFMQLISLFLGYKLRRHIGQAIAKRGKAVRTALENYNNLAKNMKPPAPHLYWKDIVNYAFIAEFDLLKHMYSQSDIADIADAPWTVPANQETAAKYFKILRARKELRRLDLEIANIRVAITSEEAAYTAALARVSSTDPTLAAELRSSYHVRSQVHWQHLRHINAIEQLPGYAQRVALSGSSSSPSADMSGTSSTSGPLSNPATMPLPTPDKYSDDQDDGDDALDEAGRLVDFVEGLSQESGIPADMLFAWQS